MIMIQSQNIALLISYDEEETTCEIAFGYVLFHMMIGGCEFTDMKVYAVAAQDENNILLNQISAESLLDMNDAFVKLCW